MVPGQNCDSVMGSTVFNGVDFKSSSLELFDVPSKRTGGIGTGEDVFVHEKSPHKVFVLPSSSKSSDLEIE